MRCLASRAHGAPSRRASAVRVSKAVAGGRVGGARRRGRGRAHELGEALALSHDDLEALARLRLVDTQALLQDRELRHARQACGGGQERAETQRKRLRCDPVRPDPVSGYR